MRKRLTAILFWGAFWGIFEASLGYILHGAAVALPGLPGALIFPAGFWCMRRAVRSGGGKAAPVGAAFIAAVVKLADFLLPGHDAIRVANPALAILLEGLAVAAFYAVGKLEATPGYPQVLGMGILWRTAFAGHLYVISLFGLPAALVTSGMATLLRFILLESFLNSLIIYAGLRLSPRLPAKSPREIRPAAAGAAFLAAAALQVLL